MAKVIPALFLLYVAAMLGYAFAHRQGPPLPATQTRLETSMIMSAAEAGPARLAVGERGRLFRQDRAGEPWSAQRSPTEATLTRVRFLDAGFGLAVGHDQVVLRSTDGGKNWQQTHSDPAAETPLFDVLPLSTTQALAIGAYGLFLESQDGGQHWKARSILPEDRHLNAITRLDDGSLLIAGEAGTLLRSQDQGANWQAIASPYEGSLFGLQELGGGRVLAYGMRGRLLLSQDYGQSFSLLPPVVLTSLFGSAPLDQGLVLVGQSGELLRSLDGAQSFQRFQVRGSPMLAAVLATAVGADAFGEGGLHALTLK